MEASLDTNVIIHLYAANCQSILFMRFTKLKVYKFIRDHEMENHATEEIKNQFDLDVEDGKIELITDDFLKSIAMHEIFKQHVGEHQCLFDYGDLGEVYAISLAKTLGCICIVTDDIKERGSHYTLMRLKDSDVMPFAFFEIIFLDYLEGKITEDELMNKFDTICSLSKISWSVRSKLNGFMRRFWGKGVYSLNEKRWMECFCHERGINPKNRMKTLLNFIDSK